MSGLMFPSSGDPEQDELMAERIRLREDRLSRNICPNGCGPMEFLSLCNRECTECGFSQFTSTPIELLGVIQ